MPLHTSVPRLKTAHANLADSELVNETLSGRLKLHNLEQALSPDLERAVKIRRSVIENRASSTVRTVSLSNLPYQGFYYDLIHGQCAENVIGMVPIPVGIAGPIVVDGKEYFVPMATTEGALIASTTRGCKAISSSGGTNTEIVSDGMTRAPCLEAPSVRVAAQVKKYVEQNFAELETAFNLTSRFARLQSVNVHFAGRKIFLRFKATSGDAMGMNMVGKGVEKALVVLTTKFPLEVVALSGNLCTDKKHSAINWVEGRGKSVIADVVIPGDIVRNVMHTSVQALCDLNVSKNLIGSSLAGSVGGSNAHAANMVAAIFLATGQDPAQVVESSNCMTLMEPCNDGQDLYMSVTMPSLEVGTIGGGTTLPAQKSMLALLGVDGSQPSAPGANAQTLARVIASTVMAGELSLLSALSTGHLISSHMKLNRHKGTHAPVSAATPKAAAASEAAAAPASRAD